jgi:hypothetical protein
VHFDELLCNLQPPDDRLKAARDLPPLVREYLKQCTDFPTVYPHTRLAGSYRQHLTTVDVKDIDTLVFVPADPEENDPPAKQMIRDLKGALDDLPNQPDALGEWHASLVEANLEIERARRSVHIHFRDHDFHLDVVPVAAPNGEDKSLYIPDRGYDQWIPTDPLGYIKLLEELNGQYGQKVKPLGRLLKHYRNQHMVYQRPKSYWLGALLVKHIGNGNLDMDQPLPMLFRDLLKAIHSDFAPILGRQDGATPHIKDPMLDHDISWNWGRSAFERFMRVVEEGRDRATRAIEALEQGNVEKAVEIWQRVFGEEYFPSNIDDALKRLAVAGMPGSAVVSRVGFVTSAGAATGPYMATQPTRFYGEE